MSVRRPLLGYSWHENDLEKLNILIQDFDKELSLETAFCSNTAQESIVRLIPEMIIRLLIR